MKAYPFDPAWKFLDNVLRDKDLTQKEWCERTGFPLETLRGVRRKRGENTLVPEAADKLACCLGLHPSSIWSNWQ